MSTPAELGPAYWYQVQRQIMAARGTTRGGYILHFAKQGNTNVQDITAHYRSDKAVLDNLAGQAERGGWDNP